MVFKHLSMLFTEKLMSIPLTRSSIFVSSLTLWLIPSIDGTNNIAVGTYFANICESWPAPDGITLYWSSTFLGSPRLGARFVDYLVTLKNQGGNKEGFGGNGVQTFIKPSLYPWLWFKYPIIKCSFIFIFLFFIS
mgnify:CR=1 FL=1